MYDLFIKVGKRKIYWNDFLKQWVDDKDSSTPFSTLELKALIPLPFNIQTEQVGYDSI